MIKNIKTLFALIAASSVMFSQTANAKIAGTVTDVDGNPLVGANVLVVGSSLGAATDELGRYFILDVPVGNYEVRAEYIGYKTYNESNVKTSVGFTTSVDFVMDVASVAGEEVTVVRERKLVNTNANNTTRVVDKELIDKSLLKKDEIKWLNNYHRQVFLTLKDKMNKKEFLQLRKACSAI